MAGSARLGRRITPGLVGALVAVALVAGCSDDEADGMPLIDRIDDAAGALEAREGGPVDFYEISATEHVVSMIVAAGNHAEQAFWSPDDGLVDPVPVAPVDRPTFRSAALDYRPDRMFDQVRDDLPNAEIIDFAITGAGNGVALYDARLQSRQGGVLLVLLGGDGRILGVQGQ